MAAVALSAIIPLALRVFSPSPPASPPALPPTVVLGQPAPEGAPTVAANNAGAPADELATPRPGLEAALALLNSGRVLAARKQLLGLVSEDGADVAWALARSYDPNFLKTIAAADADPDVEEAARWYRAWHAAALRQGLVTESVSLQRIIGSMR